MTYNSTTLSGTGTLNVDAAMSVMLPSPVADSGTAATFVKTGAGPVVLTGTNTFTPGTAFQVNAGSLVAVGQNYASPGPASGPLGSAADYPQRRRAGAGRRHDRRPDADL